MHSEKIKLQNIKKSSFKKSSQENNKSQDINIPQRSS